MAIARSRSFLTYNSFTAYSTTVTTGVASATQTVGSTAGLQAGDSLFFATAATTRIIQSITNSTTVVLTATVTTTTSEAVTRAIASGTTVNIAQVDVLGDDTSVGDIWLYALINCSASTGTIDFRVEPNRDSGTLYTKPSFDISITPNGTTNSTYYVALGKRPTARYMSCDIRNNGTGANATVTLAYSLEKLS